MYIPFYPSQLPYNVGSERAGGKCISFTNRAPIPSKFSRHICIELLLSAFFQWIFAEGVCARH